MLNNFYQMARDNYIKYLRFNYGLLWTRNMNRLKRLMGF